MIGALGVGGDGVVNLIDHHLQWQMRETFKLLDQSLHAKFFTAGVAGLDDAEPQVARREVDAEQVPRDPAVRRQNRQAGGVRVEDIADPLIRQVRYLDKLIDELARGKKMESILRT